MVLGQIPEAGQKLVDGPFVAGPGQFDQGLVGMGRQALEARRRAEGLGRLLRP
jgi:hypothetical protein